MNKIDTFKNFVWKKFECDCFAHGVAGQFLLKLQIGQNSVNVWFLHSFELRFSFYQFVRFKTKTALLSFSLEIKKSVPFVTRGEKFWNSRQTCNCNYFSNNFDDAAPSSKWNIYRDIRASKCIWLNWYKAMWSKVELFNGEKWMNFKQLNKLDDSS